MTQTIDAGNGWQEPADRMEALVMPISRRRKRLVLTMVSELTAAVAAALRDRTTRSEDAEVSGYAMVPAVPPALTRCAALMDRFAAGDPDCADAALELMVATLEYRAQQGRSAMTG